ncbi:MAG: hypothetical protein WBD74_09370 [Candidatus Aquilonibacter sp.]
MKEHAPFLVGYRAMRIMGIRSAICEELDLQFCAAAVFFSALTEIDDAGQVVDADVRDQAFRLTAEQLRGSDLDSKFQLGKFYELLEAQVRAGEFDFVTPLALLKASAPIASAPLEAGFRGIGLSLDSILNRIEHALPAEKLADEAPPVPPREWPPKYAVVIEGPGFRDTRNRYATLDKAQYVVELLEATLKGVEVAHKRPELSIFYSRPPEFKSATRVYVEELPSR